mgnify:CR=1 FL=1
MAVETPRTTLKDHLQEHALKFNIKLHDVYHAVLGEQGKGGLCDDVVQLQSDMKTIDGRFKIVCDDIADIKDTLKWVSRLVLGAVILAGLGLILVK